MQWTGAHATHNRAGEIIYKRVNNNPFLYEISVITYTKTGHPSDEADRCELEVSFGDGTSEVVSRDNGPTGSPCETGVGTGEKIPPSTRYNVYTTRHEFPGAGTYKLSMEDPMRNGGVVNMDDSDNVPFYIESYLTIDIATGGNQAPTLQNPPIDNGCVGVPFYHNPGAVDVDGDSLVYSIVASKSYNGSPISSYVFPDQVVPGINNKLSIDPRTGTMTWDSPQMEGEYNVAILIEEYRTNPNNGGVFKVGSIMRDMQIDIAACDPNAPPIITLDEKVCVTAGDVLNRTISATDPEGEPLHITAVGFPLEEGNGGSVSDPVNVNGSVQIEFTWQTRCDHVRLAPYWMYFKAKETPGELVNFKTMEINVISPSVVITNIQPIGTSLRVDWTKAVCDEATGYDVYRYDDSLGYEASECITGVPGQLGYVKVGEVDDISTTTFVDNNNGVGLIHGQRYCYMIVTRFRDGSESYPSPETCGKLIRDVPIINKVSVNSTDIANGDDSIAWYKPVELKTNIYGPPYRYRLTRSTSLTGNFEEVFLSESSQDPFALDTLFVDQGLNTQEVQYYYRIEMLSGADEISVGLSRPAASIYLSSAPSDNTLTLQWDVDVPWLNDEYVVYRFNNHPDSLAYYKVLDTVAVTSYEDTKLANLREYRYFVRSTGRYTAAELQGELINYSQIHTGTPVDNEPPCAPPNRFIVGDCDLEQTSLTWDNPNEACEDVDDVVGYKIYYAAFLGNPLKEIHYIPDPDATEYIHQANGSIAGCYAVIAVDSFDNESDPGGSLCVDNCPTYELPNVFTPGDDGMNDLFVPFPYKFVESINLVIFNRWGQEVFTTTDPDINWDGTEMSSGKPVPEGVYYYICQVNEIRLTGIETRELKGSLNLLRESTKPELAP